MEKILLLFTSFILIVGGYVLGITYYPQGCCNDNASFLILFMMIIGFGTAVISIIKFATDSR
jgi:hypothetical protein